MEIIKGKLKEIGNLTAEIMTDEAADQEIKTKATRIQKLAVEALDEIKKHKKK